MDSSLVGFEDQDFELFCVLSQTRNAVQRVRERELNENGTSIPRYAVYFIVDHLSGYATPAEISKWMVRQPHGVSGLLDRMEREGLVKRTKDLNRKNMVRITITEKGYQEYRRSNVGEPFKRVLLSLSGEERRQLKVLLLKLRDKALEEVGARKPSYPPKSIN